MCLCTCVFLHIGVFAIIRFHVSRRPPQSNAGVRCSVLQCVVECCGVLQCVAVCCSVLQCESQCIARMPECIGIYAFVCFVRKCACLFYMCNICTLHGCIHTFIFDLLYRTPYSKCQGLWGRRSPSANVCVALCCSELQSVVVCCSVLQCALQCVAVFCSLKLMPGYVIEEELTSPKHRSVLQCVAVCCSVL